VETEDEDGVEDDIGHGADEHAQHGGHHGAFCPQQLADDVVDHERRTA